MMLRRLFAKKKTNRWEALTYPVTLPDALATAAAGDAERRLTALLPDTFAVECSAEGTTMVVAVRRPVYGLLVTTRAVFDAGYRDGMPELLLRGGQASAREGEGAALVVYNMLRCAIEDGSLNV